MIALDEGHGKYEWWLNELRTLGLEVSRRNEFNDLKEISDLVNNLKEAYYTYYQRSPGGSD